ncbi:Detected protein of unknown function [Hibiscus syriacus]|uniref:Uncharacterized protein n=1 Tax=Hibiscus syriacus TaxID=106335 RepID=A0A6A2XX84_HIBSY|nr:Detected protein of unknown function [Hibiscus syriacus]
MELRLYPFTIGQEIRNVMCLNLDIYLYSGVPSVSRFSLSSILSNGEQSDPWAPLADQGWRPFLESVNALSLPQKSEGYLQVFLDGGLNQQRMGDDVSIVKELPDEFSWSTWEYYATAIRATRIKRAPVHASVNWYLEYVLPVLQSNGIAAISPFSHRLSFDNMTTLGDAIVHCLRYSPGENEAVSSNYLGETTDRYEKQSHTNLLWYIFRLIRMLQPIQPVISVGVRCPLIPEEIGLLLAALRFDNSTSLYLASHKVYGGEARISTLLSASPGNMHNALMTVAMMQAVGTSKFREQEDHKAKYGSVGPTLTQQKYYVIRIPSGSGRRAPKQTRATQLSFAACAIDIMNKQYPISLPWMYAVFLVGNNIVVVDNATMLRSFFLIAGPKFKSI